jgi:hypothetical protein
MAIVNDLTEPQKDRLRTILSNHSLAKFGDTIVNFLYSLAKTENLGVPCGERVKDKALAEALRKANLRDLMPNSLNAGELGDGVEAIVGYFYLNKLLSIEEMKNILSKELEPYNEEAYSSYSKERKIMAVAFYKLLLELLNTFKKKREI